MTDATRTVPRLTDIDRDDLIREFICRELVDQIIDEVPGVRELIADFYHEELRELWRARHTDGEREPELRVLVRRRRELARG